MASVHDVAAFILSKHGPATAKQLQKLVYYSQAWSLVWDENPLFPDEIQAWRDGPVVYSVFDRCRGQRMVYAYPSGDPSKLTQTESETIRAVLAFYRQFDGDELGELTHRETPWCASRAGLGPRDHGSTVIPCEALRACYARGATREKVVPKAYERRAKVALAFSEVAKSHRAIFAELANR